MDEDLRSEIVEFTNDMLELGGFDLDAEADDNFDGLRIDIAGDDVPLLLARNAELLDALEYVCNRAYAKDPSVENRIVFDAANYRSRREKELRLMADKAAEKVRATGVPFSFDPMSPNERRIVHLALVDDKTVETESRGDGPDRKVVIYPT